MLVTVLHDLPRAQRGGAARLSRTLPLGAAHAPGRGADRAIQEDGGGDHLAEPVIVEHIIVEV